MGFIIDINGGTVWSPALDVGTAYVACAQALGETFHLDPGFSFEATDFVEADQETFQAFATTLFTRARAAHDHPVLRDLIDAVLVPALVMLERAGTPIDLSHDLDRQTKVDRLRGMPR